MTLIDCVKLGVLKTLEFVTTRRVSPEQSRYSEPQENMLSLGHPVSHLRVACVSSAGAVLPF